MPTSNTKLSPFALFVLLSGAILSMVDSSVVNVAVPDIAVEFGAPLTAVQWSVSGYLLALAATMPATAYLGRRFGTLRTYAVSVAAFTVASVLCALADSVSTLVAARVLQGIAAAPLVPLSMSLVLGRMRSSKEIPLSAGVVLFLAPALGPTLGGVLVATWGWQFIFLVNVPIGLAALAGLPHVWRRGFADEIDRTARFDPFGLLLLSLGVTGVLYGTSEAPTRGWFTLGVMPFWVLGTVALLGYARWAWHREEPAVDLRLLRHPQSALTVGLCVIAALAMFGVLFLVPVLVQNVQGHTALESGLVLLPQGVVMGISSALGRKLTGPWLRPGIVVGFIAVAATSVLLLRVELDTPLWMTALIMAGRGFGVGLVIQPLLTGTLAGLPRRELDHANTLFNVGQRIGGSVGVSLLATLFSVRAAHHVTAALGLPSTGGGLSMSGLADVPAAVKPTVLTAVMTAFHETVWVAAAVAVAGVLGALFVRARQATDEEQVEPAEQPAAS